MAFKEISQKNSYSTSFIDKCFRKFLDRLHIIKPTLAAVKETPLCLVLPYLEPISLQVRTKISNPIKGTLNCCKLQVIFKRERKLSNMFRFKDCVPYNLVPGVVYKYMCGKYNYSYYGETERHLNVQSGEHIGISLLTFNKMISPKESLISDYLLQYDNNPSFYEFTILAHGNKKYSFEIKVSC